MKPITIWENMCWFTFPGRIFSKQIQGNRLVLVVLLGECDPDSGSILCIGFTPPNPGCQSPVTTSIIAFLVWSPHKPHLTLGGRSKIYTLDKDTVHKRNAHPLWSKQGFFKISFPLAEKQCQTKTYTPEI